MTVRLFDVRRMTPREQDQFHYRAVYADDPDGLVGYGASMREATLDLEKENETSRPTEAVMLDPEHRAWIVRQYATKRRRQTVIAREVGLAVSDVSGIIRRFCAHWADVDPCMEMLFGEERRQCALAALGNFQLENPDLVIEQPKGAGRAPADVVS